MGSHFTAFLSYNNIIKMCRNSIRMSGKVLYCRVKSDLPSLSLHIIYYHCFMLYMVKTCIRDTRLHVSIEPSFMPITYDALLLLAILLGLNNSINFRHKWINCEVLIIIFFFDRTRPKDAPFQLQPSMLPVLQFLIDNAHRIPSMECGMCGKTACPPDPQVSFVACMCVGCCGKEWEGCGKECGGCGKECGGCGKEWGVLWQGVWIVASSAKLCG